MRRIGALAAVVGLTALLCACGPSAAQKAAEEESASASAAAHAAAATKAADAKLQKQCDRALGKFQGELQSLDAKIDIGLSEDTLNNALGNINGTFQQLTAKPLNIESYCLNRVARPLQHAFRLYVATNASWNKCLTDWSCDFKRDVEPKIQAKWSQAESAIQRASKILADYHSPAAIQRP